VAHVNFEGLGQIDAKRFSASASASLAGLARTIITEEAGVADARTSIPGRNSDQSFNGVALPLLQFNHSRLAEDGGYWWWHTPDDTRDKVDAQVLKVDIDLYAGAMARLLAEPVLPVSLSAVVERLGDLLRDRQETAGSHFDFSEAIRRQEVLLERVRELEAEMAANPGVQRDLELVEILRPIHRMLYTGMGPYHPDPAVSVGSLPGLNAVEMLVENEPGSDRYRFALATLQREYARVLEGLDEARGWSAGFQEGMKQ
jgi:hypothetical protein